MADPPRPDGRLAEKKPRNEPLSRGFQLATLTEGAVPAHHRGTTRTGRLVKRSSVARRTLGERRGSHSVRRVMLEGNHPTRGDDVFAANLSVRLADRISVA